jgi:hypothetical protein
MKQNSINSRLKALRLLCQIQNWDSRFSPAGDAQGQG